ncbi:hypothetical protein D3C84_461290 [compost metagenome]
MFVDMPGNRDQIGKHRVAHRSGDLGIGQGIQTNIDDAAFSDDLHPVEDRARVIQVGVVGGQ